MPRSQELHVRFYDISYGLWEELEKPMDAKILVLYSLQLLLFHVRFATSSRDTLSRNQTIGDGEIIVSRENKFALGFFSPGNSTYRYLGIWYHGLPEQAVIWVANRNTPINGSSGILLLNQHGNLVLYSSHDQRVAVWSADVSVAVTETCMAQLLDSGNFVLSVQDASNIVWQSFDYPTNTMIRGMRFRINRKTGQEHFLTSWRSADDPGTGDYSLKLNPGGSPQFVMYKGTKDYWRSCPWPWRKYAFVYNYTFVNNPDEVFFADLQEDPSSLQRTVLDDTGLMKRLILDESTDGKWKVVWSAPMYRCHSYGRCGLYSECDAPSEGKFGCACLPGYEPNLERGRYLGDGEGSCVKKQQQSLMCEQGEGFVRVENVKVPDAQGGVWLGANVGLLACEQQCMSNFSCLAYAIADVAGRGHGCMVWYGKLMDSLEFAEEGYDLYACADALQLAESTRISHGVFQRKGMLAILVLSIVSAWIVIVIIAVLLLRKSRNRRAVRRKWSKRIFDANSLDQYKDTWAAKEFEHNESHPDLAFFDLSTILAATNNFSPYNKLGQGGFGSVYKGQLYNEQEVAVKRLSNSSGQGMEEFANEVTLIAKLQHRNLVKLLGYCIEGEEPMLIYEYLPNKSLDSFLFDDTRKTLLDWRKRFDIIFGIARGILYLHQDSRLRIIHRDLKTSNVLLDEEKNPKISDFGMARIFKDDQIQSKTRRVVGTYGYMSPEYAVFGRFSVKSDVFSFGVILLEIISGKKNSNFYHEDPAMSLIGYAWELWREERALEMVDLSLKESYPPREAMRCIQIGLLCVQEDAKDRPTMLDVVFMLNSDMPLPSPKQPAFIFRNCVNQMNLPVGDQEQQCSVNEITITTVLSR